MKGGSAVFVGLGFLAMGAWDAEPSTLKYGWKRGEPHVYTIELKIQEPEYVASARGQMVFTARAANIHGFTIRSHNFLSIQRHSLTGRLFPPFGVFKLGWRHFDGNSGGRPLRAPTDVVINPRGGHIGSQVPIFDPVAPSRLVLETLPDELAATWQTRNNVLVVHERRTKPEPGSRLVKLTKTHLPAEETITYTRGANTGHLIAIKKQYQLATTGNGENQPTITVSGDADLMFNTLTGIFETMQFTGKLTVTDGAEVRIVPMTLSYERLTGDRREAALRPPAPAGPVQIRPLPAADLNQCLVQLQRRLSFPRLQAADKLSRAEPTNRLAEVSAALVTVLNDTDPYTRQAACRALALWGDHDAVSALIKRLDDTHLTVRWAAIEALARLQDPRAALPIARHLASNRETLPAVAALQLFGSAAEPVLRPLLKSNTENLRHAACRLLGAIGTPRSALSLLRLQRGADSVTATLAQRALRQIIQRHGRR